MTIHDPATATAERLAANLPPADTRRWVASRKAAVVNAINGGVLKHDEAIERYGLTEEELSEWCGALASHGARGLLATRARQSGG
ncbi:MAG: DUF1153 domain-containing protein [Pikeienuella sp.]